MTLPASTIRRLCIEGFRRNRVPAVVLQAVAAALLAGYFFAPPLRPAFDAVSDLKQKTDPWFAMVSTAFFAGAVPWMVSLHRGRIPPGRGLPHLIGMMLYWAVAGGVVDALYTFQDRIFGSDRDIGTLALKTLVDQGPFNLIWATPACLVFYGWKEADFNWSRFRRAHPRPVVLRKYITIQVSCWIVWIPAVAMIYAMPLGLQQPLFNLVICFFSLLLLFINRE
jgi:hypothetical protein